MKRTALLIAILIAFSLTAVSQVYASPIAGEKAVTVSSWLSYYIANFLRAHRVTVGYEDGLISDAGENEILRGDADDYANGKGDIKDLDPIIPNDDKKITEQD